MRFMIIIKASPESEAGQLPSQALLSAMGAYNEELAKAGVILAGEGLQPSSRGARVHFSGSRRHVTHGPFSNAGTLVAGFWIFNVASLQEAIDWVLRCPNPMVGDAEIEIRPLFEAEDFGEHLTPELREQEARLRAGLAAKP
ncbi:YciI family protein [Pseudomonas putida]|uniref:YciI family protein n=1 Tax=Pseudomonas putida TaxID=303 RepID=UPI002363A66F|nr:YciI family protein [Pseudomonas putida]MDD2054404.1 YciI family protein [Pseudomonas putida]